MTVEEEKADERDFGWSLGVLLRALHGSMGRVLKDFPHGPRGYLTLSTVVHGDQPSQLALAAHLGIDRTVMTYLIDDLVEAGLVERRPNPADRRQRKIVPTERGVTVLGELERRVRAIEDHVLRSLSPEERESFRGMLRRVACGVADVDAGTDPCDVVDELLGGERRR
ncbi:MarR family winged helix-turn-helix transcriptional regulator [Nonomuraea wenchangensis]|uniref:MarR family winged helix-turn-helix transcriptional regulator n=1 Tax=Nonomuraea wenchangensis TaxID=568860 RepID=UPI00343A49EC